MKANPELNKFLEPYSETITKLTFDLRAFLTDLVPQANELIWDNYNAVALAYSKSEKLKDAFCHIAVYSKHVNFGFNRGAELTNRKLKLKGKGKLIRHISVKEMNSFPKVEIEKLIWEAVGISEEMNEDLLKANTNPKSIVMSISANKVRPKKETN